MSKRQRRPLSPEAAAVVRAQLAGPRAGVSRRAVLGGAGALGLGALLSACGTGEGSESGPSPAADLSDSEKVVNWANWTLYLDYEDSNKTYPTLVKFEDQTKIRATYAEDIDDNDTYWSKIQGQLRNGQDIGKDVVVFTDYMAARMIRQGYAQKLNKANIPNAANINEALRDVAFDRGRNYSLTWQSGFAGLAWNKAAVPEGMKNVADLWNPKYKGRIEVLSEFRDTLGLIMMADGVNIEEDFGADQFGAALETLEKQLSSGQIRQVKGNSYKEDLISGDAVAVIGWSGDITQLNFENDDQWAFAIPESGGTLWSDNMLVPIGSPHKKNAEILMNYYYDPRVAAEVAEYVNYVCPVVGAQEEMENRDASLANNPLIFPDDAFLETVQVFRPLEPAEETQFTTDFQKVLGV